MQSSLTTLHAALSGARLTVASATFDVTFDGVVTDSRAVASGNLFVALRGERFDAHDFLAQVAASGAAAVVAERVPDGFPLPALIVPDTRIALGEIGRFWRSQFSIPVIAVTGSNGKTTVKEMIASILRAQFGEGHFLATGGNFNNEIGVPLTLLRLNADHRAAVIELGMNHPGEIALLAAMACPTVAHVNNAQREHQEFMATVEAVARENGSVLAALPADGVAVFPGDDVYTPLWQGLAGARASLGFGLGPDCAVRGDWKPSGFGSEIAVHAEGQQFTVQLAAAGVHNVRNALAAAACALAIGVPVDAVVRGLETFLPVSGRLQKKRAASGATVIDDTYNANPDSVRAAIDVLAQAPAPRVLVLGDMGEVGDEGVSFHQEIGAYAKAQGIEGLFTLGELAAHAAAAFGAGAEHARDLNETLNAVDRAAVATATVLVKGSRFMRMERVVRHLTGETTQEAH